MGEARNTPLYKLRAKVRVPFVKDFVIESIDKKAWIWLIKILNINYEAEMFARIESYDNNYTYYDDDNPNGKNITAEEANSMINKNYSSNSKILERIYKYNIPIYYYSNYPMGNGIIRRHCSIIANGELYALYSRY